MLSIKFSRQISPLVLSNRKQNAAWSYCSKRGVKVAVVGAAGGIGQPLSLLLKQNPMITSLALHDIGNIKGVVADLSHICTATSVKAFEGKDQLAKALENAAIVVVPAGLPRKPGMSRADLLSKNGDVAVDVAKAMSVSCPSAFLALITNPINTILPIAAEVLKQNDAYDPKRIFGVTTLDVVRAKTFIGEGLGLDPQCVSIPVIGGHAGETILPLISQSKPQFEGCEDERRDLVKRIQEAGTEVVKAKAGKGSATLSMAYAAAHFVNALLRGINGEENVIECAYVESDVSEALFFATPVLLGPKGIEKNLGLPELDEQEEKALEKLTPILMKEIEDGIKFAC